MFRKENLCPGSKNVFEAKKKFVSEQQNLFPQHMLPARLNWKTFASATMFPSLASPLAYSVFDDPALCSLAASRMSSSRYGTRRLLGKLIVLSQRPISDRGQFMINAWHAPSR